MRELDDMDGFRIGGTVVNNLRYADDTVIIAESEEQLQRLINHVLILCVYDDVDGVRECHVVFQIDDLDTSNT